MRRWLSCRPDRSLAAVHDSACTSARSEELVNGRVCKGVFAWPRRVQVEGASPDEASCIGTPATARRGSRPLHQGLW